MNICFINYFLYINLKEVHFFYFKSPSYCNLGPDVRLNFWCISAARLWCCNIFWGNGSRIKLFLKSKMFNWWTVSQCHMRSKWWYYNAPKFRGKRKIGYSLVLFRSRIIFCWFVCFTNYDKMWAYIFTEIKVNETWQTGWISVVIDALLSSSLVEKQLHTQYRVREPVIYLNLTVRRAPS